MLQPYAEDLIREGAPAVLVEARVGDEEWSHAVGVRNSDGVPVQRGDPVQVGGITRTMVAVSVLKLVDEGRLALEDRITGYLPELEGLLSPAGPPSVREVLGDMSGMPDFDAAPGLLVERLRGMPLADVLRADIVEPLGLRSTAMTGDGTAPANLVHGYTRVDGELVDVADPALRSGSESGGVFASVEDINTFYAALLRGDLLSPASVVEMKGRTNADYGLGLDHWSDRCTNGVYYGHSGDVPGYGTVAISSADGHRQLAVSVAYPPAPLPPGPHALGLEMTGLAQSALNASCRPQFRWTSTRD